MNVIIKGEIIDFVPWIKAYVREEGLILSEEGDIALAIDTGFSGAVALSGEMLEKMNVRFIGYDTFTLATGEIVELPMFLGKVIIDNQETETWFITGDLLLGMEFLSFAGKVLTLNFEEAVVELRK